MGSLAGAARTLATMAAMLAALLAGASGRALGAPLLGSPLLSPAIGPGFATLHALADLDGDGRLDVVAQSSDPLSIAVLLGLGDGTLAPPVSVPAGEMLGHLAVGDVTGDGRPDVVTAGSMDTGGGVAVGVVSVLAGNGDGTFLPPASTGIGAGPAVHDVALGDLNGDGHLDVVVLTAGPPDGALTVLLGSPGGALTAGAPIDALGTRDGLAVLDANGDGKLDVASAGASGVLVRLGNGDGSFGAVKTVSALDSVAVVPADLNGDPVVDLVGVRITGGLTPFVGGGDGTFTAQPPVDVQGVRREIAVEDVDLDGAADLIVPDAGGVRVIYGAGDGTFPYPSEVFSVASPSGADLVQTGDLDGDGRPDVAAAGAFGAVAVLLNQRQGLSAIVAADLNGDDWPDVAVAETLTDRVSVLMNRANASDAFLPAIRLPAGPAPVDVASADLDGDGRLDLALAGAAGIAALLGPGTGTVAAPIVTPTGVEPLTGLALADLDRDGRQDAAVMGLGGLAVLHGRGDGSFATAPPIATPPGALAVADLDLDGNPDIAVAAYATGAISIFKGRGDGSLAAPEPVAGGGAGASDIAIADLNGDGRPDLAIAGENGATVLLGRPGGFAAPTTVAAGTAPTAIGVLDFDLDGIPDLAVANAGSDDVSILVGAGDGTVLPRRSIPAGSVPAGLVVADVNRDFRPDLLVANFGSDDLTDFLSNASFPRPDVTTGAVADVGPTGATLTGAVNPYAVPGTTVHFEFGPTTAYGLSTPARAALGRGDRPVREALAGLAPESVIHYRLVASSSLTGVTAGGDATLVTAPAPEPQPMPQPRPVTKPPAVGKLRASCPRPSVRGRACNLTISFSLSRRARVQISLRPLRGKKAVLARALTRPGGKNRVLVAARAHGRALPAGPYVLTVRATSGTLTSKIVTARVRIARA